MQLFDAKQYEFEATANDFREKEFREVLTTARRSWLITNCGGTDLTERSLVIKSSLSLAWAGTCQLYRTFHLLWSVWLLKWKTRGGNMQCKQQNTPNSQTSWTLLAKLCPFFICAPCTWVICLCCLFLNVKTLWSRLSVDDCNQQETSCLF